MTLYYIEYGTREERKLFSFDATTEMTLSESGSATSFRLENGRAVSDHYSNNNVAISFSGRISDVKSIRRQNDENNSFSTTREFITELRALKQSGTPFKVYAGANIGGIDNCVFETLDIRQDVANGTRVASGGKEVSSFRMNFSAVQIRFGARAQAVAKPDPLIEKSTAPERPKAGQTNSKTGVTFVRFGNTIYSKTQYEAMAAKTGNLPDVNTLPVVESKEGWWWQ